MVNVSEIAGELCECGHQRTEHHSMTEVYDDHGGHCEVCECIRYTWDTFINAKGEAIK